MDSMHLLNLPASYLIYQILLNLPDFYLIYQIFINKPLRICLDPRHIDAVLSEDRYPMPNLRDLLDSISGSTHFSSLDLEQSYHQFFIQEEDQIKTSFTWNHVQYMFRGAPFGLKTLTSIFQRVMT